MSNIFELSYFQRAFSDPARLESVAQRIAARLTESHDWSSDFVRRVRWFGGLCNVAFQCGEPQAWLLVSRAADLAADECVYSPSLELQLAAFHRPISSREAARLFGRWGFESDDRAFAIDRLSEWGTFMSCESCGEDFSTHDLADAYGGEVVCESCREDHYEWSSHHDAWVHSNNCRTALDASGDRCIIHEDADDFVFDEHRDMYVHVDISARSVIHNYHSSKGSFEFRSDDWTARHNRYIGVELEVEGHTSEPQAAARVINEAVNGGDYGKHLFLERDGSLSAGFEMITHPQSLSAHRELFAFLRNPVIVRGLRSHRTSTCGLHVHVSRSGLSNLTIARAVTFINDPGNDAFVTALARRYSSTYCRVVEKDLETAHQPGDRYEAINLTGRDTIEFRIFRGSLKYEAVISAIEFSHAILEFCARAETGSSSLNARAFLSFCAIHMEAETRILRAYVAERTAGLFQHSEAA